MGRLPKDVAAWAKRDLAELKIRYLFLDGWYPWVRIGKKRVPGVRCCLTLGLAISEPSSSLCAAIAMGSRSASSPRVEELIRAAPALITSRLSPVESSRALHRLRQLGQVSEAKLAGAQREINAVWTRCELWELTPLVCERARQVAPGKSLRTTNRLR